MITLSNPDSESPKASNISFLSVSSNVDNSSSMMTLEKNFDKIELSAYIYELLNSSNIKNNIEVSNPYTMQILKELNFNWSEINSEYLNKGLEEFFNEEPNEALDKASISL